MVAGTVLEATGGPLGGGVEAAQVDRVGPTLDGLEVEVVGVDQDSADPEVEDGVAQDPTHSVALEDGIQDLGVTAAVDLQMAGIALAWEAVRILAVGSLVGNFVFNQTFKVNIESTKSRIIFSILSYILIIRFKCIYLCYIYLPILIYYNNINSYHIYSKNCDSYLS